MLKTLLLSATFMIHGIFANIAQADTIVLVHGAFQDARVWSAVTPLLEAKGHKVIAVNLPGRTKNPQDDISLAGNRDVVLQAIGGSDEKVVLVGHSFGGFTISAVAEAVPERISTAIYVAAYLPMDGESMQELSKLDQWNKFTQENFVVAKDYSSASILERDRKLIFCEACTDVQTKTLRDGMIDEPLKPFSELISLSGASFGVVRKAYIFTNHDNAVSLELQQMMKNRTKVAETIEIDSGHAVAISNSDELAAAILSSL